MPLIQSVPMVPRALLVLACLASPALAQDPGPAVQPPVDAAPFAASPADAVFEALRLPEIIDVMSEEGAQYGDVLAEQLFPQGAAPEAWSDMVADLYDPARMEARAREQLAQRLDGADTDAILAFFDAEPGRTFAELELAARRSMLDPEVEQAANEAAAMAMAADGPRVELIRRYVEANDLVEQNVVSALNTNAAYLMGLLDGGGMGTDMTESDVLADVAAQEPQLRADTTEWLYSFLLMAYEPASDADLEALIAFSETEPGRALNGALFHAFDGVFEDISRALGLASAREMATEDI